MPFRKRVGGSRGERAPPWWRRRRRRIERGYVTGRGSRSCFRSRRSKHALELFQGGVETCLDVVGQVLLLAQLLEEVGVTGVHVTEQLAHVAADVAHLDLADPALALLVALGA